MADTDSMGNTCVLLELVVVHTNVPHLVLTIMQCFQSDVKLQKLAYDLAHGNVFVWTILCSFCL